MAVNHLLVLHSTICWFYTVPFVENLQMVENWKNGSKANSSKGSTVLTIC